MAEKNFERLADRVLFALDMALNQKDVTVADLLGRALEMSLTRGSGGKNFVERREFTEEVETALTRLDALRKK